MDLSIWIEIMRIMELWKEVKKILTIGRKTVLQVMEKIEIKIYLSIVINLDLRKKFF